VAPFLQVSQLNKAFGGVAAVTSCSLDFERGSITGLIGPNGAGKTTLLNLICGLERPDSGRVVFQGRDITGLAPHRVAALGLVRTFQIVREFRSLTVLENLLVAPTGQGGETITGALLRRGKIRETERRHATRARALLERVGLWRLADQPAGALSGGQKKLLELARALLLDPVMIMLDEPAAGVAPPLLSEIIQLIRELRQEGVSFGLVEHDMALVGALCDTVHVLAEGQTLVSGTFLEVTSDRRVVDAYLGVAA
jgi:ABC-type branched-subunit amino acid transport system ATPase component